MTHRAVGARGGVPRIWLLPIVVVTAILGVTATGLLSRSIVLDLLAWWPVWLLLVVLAVAARGRRIGKLRLPGLVPLITTAALVTFVVGHLLAWPIMPSTSQQLIGPVVGAETSAALSARLAGDLRLSAGADHLYEVDPLRFGGGIGVPEAIEQIQGSAVSIVLSPPADPGLYSFSGWDITVSTLPLWSLTLEGDMEADLTGLDVMALQVSGGGMVTLGEADTTVAASVSGDFEMIVSSAIPVRIVGSAVVPDSWQQLSDGARSPTPGEGWVVSVREGSTLTVTEG